MPSGIVGSGSGGGGASTSASGYGDAGDIASAATASRAVDRRQRVTEFTPCCTSPPMMVSATSAIAPPLAYA
eukprot:1825229-Lingulodinium_polyedra.AAC.1